LEVEVVVHQNRSLVAVEHRNQEMVEVVVVAVGQQNLEKVEVAAVVVERQNQGTAEEEVAVAVGHRILGMVVVAVGHRILGMVELVVAVELHSLEKAEEVVAVVVHQN
jgi:hypothetical protein